MTRPQLATRVGAGWMASAVGLFLVLGASTARDWIVFAVAGFLMPAVLVLLTGTYPPRTIAEVLSDTESGQ